MAIAVEGKMLRFLRKDDGHLAEMREAFLPVYQAQGQSECLCKSTVCADMSLYAEPPPLVLIYIESREQS